MRRIGCADLERIGLWNASRCCVRCHSPARDCDSDLALEMDLGIPGGIGAARLDLCCTAGADVDLSGQHFAQLLGQLDDEQPAAEN